MQEVFEKILEKLEGMNIENQSCDKCVYIKECDYMQEKNDIADNVCLCTMLMKLKAVEIVEQAAAEDNNGWIPCSKELPPQPKENPIFDSKPLELYLVTEKYADYPIRAFWNGKFFTDGWSKVDVLAWQPLPEPYTKGE